MKSIQHLLFAGVMAMASSSSFAAVSSADFVALPPLITDSSDPFVMINLSVELTQQAEAYTDGAQTLLGGTYCPGRKKIDGTWYGICYNNTETYLGYFDPDKCYTYDTTGSNANRVQSASGPQAYDTAHHFRPVAAATDRQCDGTAFSGNFMNWASMTALDEFRYAMTGGARIFDTSGASAKTWLTRTHRYGDWSFVSKRIRASGLSQGGYTFTNDPRKVTPFNENEIQVINGGSGNRVEFRNGSGTSLGYFNVIVSVCEKDQGLEANCVEYTDGTNTWYKPEGVMQEHALKMRYALTSYTGDDSHKRNGGVLRANAKYIGPWQPGALGGLESNPNAEYDTEGVQLFNPDSVALGSGVNNSGIINYINGFGLGPERYKSYDPVAELYYEGLRYIKNLGPTPEYSGAASGLSALTNNQKDNFPVVNTWDDPVLHKCQKNFIIAIGDQFSWEDNSLPGCTTPVTHGTPAYPSNPDTDIDTDKLTDTVGTLENYYSGTLGSRTRGRNNNGWYFAGLAYYAATEDVRSDIEGIQRVKTFVVDTQEYNSNPPMKQNNPLWLAAKYGGFDDANGDNDPNDGSPGTSTAEWDADGDGDPDAYTLASQPANLIQGLSDAFTYIAQGVSSASAASVITVNAEGDGANFQALYKPTFSKDSLRVDWVGMMQALLVDAYGNLREDTDSDGAVSNADKVITYEQDKTGLVLVRRNTTADGGATYTPDSGDDALVSIESMKTLWNARDELAKVAKDGDVVTQRAYTAQADSGRYIFTALDTDTDGLSLADEVLDFDAVQFPAASDGINKNYTYLGLTASDSTGDQSPDIVNFIRGLEGIDGFRSRSIEFSSNATLGDGNEQAWILGDIIHSSPVVVSRPNEFYDRRYGDDTYRDFRLYYWNRRTMVYTGSNDGMLHAFNGGFYSMDEGGYRLQSDSGTETEHPLGAEIWSYVPTNVLAHLRWLTEKEYPHNYYVDGIPQVFDVNIFADDDDHPEGWGTILVVGLRFGGSDIEVDTDDDGTPDFTNRSSYVVLDITNPEEPPELIAEITHPNLGYATTRPTVIKRRMPDDDGDFTNPSYNQWFLVMGSGPYGSDAAARDLALTDAVSDQNAKIFVFNLKGKSFVEYGGQKYLDVPGASNAFVGDLTSADWDGDGIDDAVYFGTVGGTVATPTGELMRMRVDSSILSASISKLVNKSSGLNQPINGKPYVVSNTNGQPWVMVGTGRFYVAEDGLSTPQHAFMGVKEPLDGDGKLTYASVSFNDLVQTTGIVTGADGTVDDADGNDPLLNTGTTVKTFLELKKEVASYGGWYREFDLDRSRNVGRLGMKDDGIYYTVYEPSGDECDIGETYLEVMQFETGATAPYAPLGLSDQFVNSGDYQVNSRIFWGHGLVRDIVKDKKFFGTGSDGVQTVADPDSKPVPPGRTSWREVNVTW